MIKVHIAVKSRLFCSFFSIHVLFLCKIHQVHIVVENECLLKVDTSLYL